MLIDTIIIGHSLENDLRALKLIHLRCIDTALLYFQYRKRSLEGLYKQYIDTHFRDNNNVGHDSCEDAYAAVKLAQKLITSNDSFADQQLPSFLKEIGEKHGKLALIEQNNEFCYTNFPNLVDSSIVENDDIVADKIFEKIGSYDVIFAHFYGLDNCGSSQDELIDQCDKYDHLLNSIISKLPSCCALLIYSPNANLNILRNFTSHDDNAERNLISDARQGLLWIKCTATK